MYERATHGDVSRAGATLTVDLGALVENYRILKTKLRPGVRCAAVLKADAYGLGVRRVAPALAAVGCVDFFVAHVDEGLLARKCLPASASIYILNGLPQGAEADAEAAALTPVLNSVKQVEAWSDCAAKRKRRLQAILQFDTGMSRFGLSPKEAYCLLASKVWRSHIELCCVMTHFACADEPSHPENLKQLMSFQALARQFGDVPTSLANSSGIFLDSVFHGDLVRPGAALYGINPVPLESNPMRPVAQLSARVVQTRIINPGDGVGYGLEFRPERPFRLATLSIGYADGISRALGNRGTVYFRGNPLPIVGRLSMDSMVIGLSDAVADAINDGSYVDLIGPDQSLDHFARSVGTIGYEVLAGLGPRIERIYRYD